MADHRDWSFRLDVDRDRSADVLLEAMTGDLHLTVQTGRTNVLLCGHPKSASVYLTDFLGAALGLRHHRIGLGRADGGIHYPRLLAAKFQGEDTISHCHAPASPQTLKMIRNLDLRVVVTWRNLPDAIVSRRDMLLKDRWAGSLSQRAVDRFLEAPAEAQFDFIIETFGPQFLGFFGTWRDSANAPGISPCFIAYQHLVEDPVALARRAAEHLGIAFDPMRCRTALRTVPAANFNRGIAGRGAMLTPGNIARLRAMAQRHGVVDRDYLGFEP